ncbi:transglutaminase family protein [Halomonas sp.]|uniref:transglutaminase family protein n=1 Tax=Halomonas sp. TaxID=1486246 RepID=UPI00257DA27E|nr:transglutaminase family protein [Halomonas sp.]MCJ8284556.1 transglutaminase family protein [Halomonas sp.]NQY69610.1 transglutaminase family protein [Halomonas sp.]
MIYRLRHTTRYHYSEIVTLSENEACLMPREMAYQQVAWAHLSISPGESLRQSRQDAFGNHIALFAVDTPHTQLEVTLEAQVMTSPRATPPQAIMGWERCRERLADRHQPGFREAQPFLENSAYIERRPLLAAWAEDCFPAGGDLVDCVERLNRRIHEEFRYDSEFSDMETTPSQVLQHRRGVCQDFAHLAIATLRSVGLAARYVSGYLETLPPPGQPRLMGADASHAWFSVLIPGWGWLDFDPTNGVRAGERHLLLGWGRDYEDVAPLKGVVTGGGRQRLEVEVDVVPAGEVAATGPTSASPGDHPAAPIAG